jgi:hypothetical protein
MSGPLVRIELSMEHAKALGSLLDLATRIHMGQVSEIASLVEAGTLPVRDDRAPRAKRPATEEENLRVEAAVTALRDAIGHTWGSYFGIGHVSEEAKRGYEIMKAVRKTVHDHLHPDERHVVDADGVLVRYAAGPVPVATIVEEHSE